VSNQFGPAQYNAWKESSHKFFLQRGNYGQNGIHDVLKNCNFLVFLLAKMDLKILLINQFCTA
jgi:hypothetical protein